MAFRIASFLLAFLLVPSCLGAGTAAKAKAKAKDPWDMPEGGGEEAGGGFDPSQAAPMTDEGGEEQGGGGGGGGPPGITEDIMAQVEARRAKRNANKKHGVMGQFMKTFANNMRLSVLADSKGDMPEAERQRLIAKAETEKASAEPQQESFGPPPQEEAGASEEAPEPEAPPRRMAPRRHVLNMASHRRAPVHHRLLPEAEGIGFPAPEGMASDPATEAMTNDPGSTSFGNGGAPEDEAPPPPQPRMRRHAMRRQRPPPRRVAEESDAQEEAPPPPPRRHHIHMLNMRPGAHKSAHQGHHHAHHTQPAEQEQPADQEGAESESLPTLPPGVVADEMGRKMPLLGFGGKSAHSGAAAFAPLAAVGIACLALLL